MKRLVLIIIALYIALPSMAQIVDPVSWNYKVNKTGEDKAELIIEADIEPGWHLYGQDFASGGPVRTNFTFNESDSYELVGKTVATPKPKKEFDEIFQMDVTYFSDKVTFKQEVRLLTEKSFTIKGNIEYQVCQDDKCVYFNPGFQFNIKGEGGEAATPEQSEQEETPELEKSEETADIDIERTKSTQEKTSGSGEDKSLLGLFFMALGLGLVGILTPCVYPMIPMTVTFFMQGQSNKVAGFFKALIFGVSIVFLYTLVGIIVSLTSAGADFANTISTHWIPNLIFFLLFLVFAASFFGFFEIVLPSGLANKADRQVDKGGFLASFFMALTLVIVSFSCTGPIVGGLLVKAASGGVVEPTIGMLGFGIGFGLPFTILAIFPGWLKNMPKSGGWMNAVKVVLAFIILAFSFYFLSKIESNYHLDILSRDVFIAIWIAIFFTLGLYLLGKFKMAHDSEITKIPVLRMLLAVASFTFAIYLVPGLFGANLTPLSSVMPPKSEQNFNITAMSAPQQTGTSPTMCEEPRYGDFLSLPYGIKGYFEYEQGIECAQELDKPVMLYFTGHACSNCKKMQAEVWSNSEVQKILNEEYVVIALYVDDKKKLPESEWVKSEYDGKMKKTLGKKNADLQITKFNTNTQPYYLLLNSEGEPISESMGYELDEQVFLDYLKSGLEE
jgi:thiol:disulfide interchange protein DsbD